MEDEGIIAALAAASQGGDPLLANVLASEALNRVRRKETVFRHAAEGLLALDEDGQVVFINPAAEAMLGRSLADLRGRNFHDLAHRDHEGRPYPWKECPIFHLTIGKGVTTRSESDLLLRSDGTLFPVDYVAAAVRREGHIDGAVIVFRDITERQEAARAIRESEAQHRFLDEASALLSSSLDPEKTLRRIAYLTIPTLGDWCVVHLVNEQGEARPVAFAHEDSSKVRLAEALHAQHPPEPDATQGLPHVLRTGEPELIPQMTDALLAQRASDPDQRDLLRELGMASSLVVAIRSRGHVLGALSLARSDFGHPYGPRELALAQELARRAALAIENASHLRLAQEAVAAVREGENRYRRLVESIREYAIFGLDAQGRIANWNESARRLLGHQEEDVVGQPFAILHTPEDVEANRPHRLLEAAEEDGMREAEGWARRADGAAFWSNILVTAVRDDTGETTGYSVVVRDLTERRRTQTDLAYRVRQQAVAANLGLAALQGMPLDKLLQRATRETAQTLQVDHATLLEADHERQEFRIRATHGLEGPDLEAYRIPMDRASQAAHTLAADTPILVEDFDDDPRFGATKLPNGRIATAGMSVTVSVGEEQPYGVLGVHTYESRTFTPDDLHFLQAVANVIGSAIQRTRNDETLRALNAELECRVATRTAELKQRNEALEAFGHSVSHDLRAPLRGIQHLADVLREDAADALDPDQRRLLDRLVEESTRVGRLVEDLLHLSRVDSNEPRREGVDITQLARQVISSLQEAHPARKVHVRVAPGLRARADPQLARVLLENLIGNAWKYTAKREDAQIEVGETEEGAFYVRDNGAGFDPTRADRLFRPFSRLHASHEFEGTGLGLATVKRIAERHGGRVWADGRVGEGATFFFTLASVPPPRQKEISRRT